MRVRTVIPSLLLFPWSIYVAQGEVPDFNRDIRPILSENCFHCHGPDKEAREGSLRLDTYEGATEGGEFASPIVPGKPEESEVMTRIRTTDPDDLMPPPKSNRSLTEKQKKLLQDWIASGAEYEEHWAWVPPARAPIPITKTDDQVNNPVDSFLLRRLREEGLNFSDRAPAANLLRRLSLDLIGLPPSPEDLARFAEAFGEVPQDSPDKEELEAKAYEAEVDRLLASPRFGERWARPWLDLARYADSNGFQADQIRPSWAYRDWVIDALNANMPYDQFTIEQLAGDLLPEPDIRQKVATGFHRTVPCNVEAGVSPEGNRVNQVVDRVNTTATVWLGITLECAQCHDHKFDPFTMKDYYSLFAFFNNTPLEVQPPSNINDVSHDFVGPYLDLPLSSDQKRKAAELDLQLADLTRQLEARREESESEFAVWEKNAASVDLPEEIASILEKQGAKRNARERRKLKAHFLKLHPALAKVEGEMALRKKERSDLEPDQTLVMVELEEPRETHILTRGDFLSPGDQVHPATPARLPKLEASSNRLDLARWLVRRDNPLTARVAVNRWWAEIFGSGIVATLEDFGTQSEPPTHPQLLDWLAVELMESGWDMKHVLKTIVLSQAYQQSSRLTPELLERDPRNLLYARAPRFRMDAERLRDNALEISGLLSTRMHGEPVMPYQPPGLWRQTGRNEPKWEEQKDENRWRRGIYIVYRRAAPYPSMVNFDAPDRSSCTVKRPRTNTPSQALTMLNDPAYVEMALAFADRILSGSDSPETRVEQAFRLALGRSATDKESLIVSELVRNRLAHFQNDPKAAEILLNNPKFVYEPKYGHKIELASWFNVANTLLNLDETMTRN